jgi:3-hydroxyisobutyrate dehydrogenase-like beta-hydroxyacid dehydrogenase
MEIGFIGLGHMGFPMARRLIQANHRVVAFDTRAEALDKVGELGAQPASSPIEVADVAETVMAVGSQTAVQVHGLLAGRGIAAIDSPVSGGVSGAENGTLAVMVSGPRTEFELLKPAFETIGRPLYIGEMPGSAQTMKLANNILAATVLVATAEVVVMGVKSGLDPGVMIDALNAGSGATSASRDKFPRAILPRTFDYGFATGLMVKDVRLYLDEAKALGVPVEVAEAVGRLWDTTMRDEGADSDFTSAIKPIERAAGVVVGPVGQ